MGFGSARLFAFTLLGDLIWKSDIVALVSGCTLGNLSEHHERIANSSPLVLGNLKFGSSGSRLVVLGNKVYVGVHDAGDNPIQQGRVSVVDLSSGKLVPFSYVSTGTLGDGTRGGGVWNSPATDGAGVYFTTGNTRCYGVLRDGKIAYECQPEPNPNHGLSMIRVDKDTGNIVWAFQPVPYNLDDDPDWAAGATVMSTSCGEMIASVQKDGWSYAVNAGNGVPGLPDVRWQFPPTGYPFDPNGAHDHGGDGYYRPGAAWNDMFIVGTGGESLVHDTLTAGYGKLHALYACATTEKDRVRWIADIPHTSPLFEPNDPRCRLDPNDPRCPRGPRSLYSLGAPTVTGGIVFIGTDKDPIDNKGHLVVLGDPSVVFGAGMRCSNIDYLTPPDCRAFGYNANVPIPKILADVPMPDGGDIAGLRKEPALAKGRVFVGTD